MVDKGMDKALKNGLTVLNTLVDGGTIKLKDLGPSMIQMVTFTKDFGKMKKQMVLVYTQVKMALSMRVNGWRIFSKDPEKNNVFPVYTMNRV